MINIFQTDNNITREGIRIMNEGLKSNTSLTELDLRSKGLTILVTLKAKCVR